MHGWLGKNCAADVGKKCGELAVPGRSVFGSRVQRSIYSVEAHRPR